MLCSKARRLTEAGVNSHQGSALRCNLVVLSLFDGFFNAVSPEQMLNTEMTGWFILLEESFVETTAILMPGKPMILPVFYKKSRFHFCAKWDLSRNLEFFYYIGCLLNLTGNGTFRLCHWGILPTRSLSNAKAKITAPDEASYLYIHLILMQVQ